MDFFGDPAGVTTVVQKMMEHESGLGDGFSVRKKQRKDSEGPPPSDASSSYYDSLGRRQQRRKGFKQRTKNVDLAADSKKNKNPLDMPGESKKLRHFRSASTPVGPAGGLSLPNIEVTEGKGWQESILQHGSCGYSVSQKKQ